MFKTFYTKFGKGEITKRNRNKRIHIKDIKTKEGGKIMDRLSLLAEIIYLREIIEELLKEENKWGEKKQGNI